MMLKFSRCLSKKYTLATLLLALTLALTLALALNHVKVYGFIKCAAQAFIPSEARLETSHIEFRGRWAMGNGRHFWNVSCISSLL